MWLIRINDHLTALENVQHPSHVFFYVPVKLNLSCEATPNVLSGFHRVINALVFGNLC